MWRSNIIKILTCPNCKHPSNIEINFKITNLKRNRGITNLSRTISTNCYLKSNSTEAQETTDNKLFRKNDLDIQMLSKGLFKQVFIANKDKSINENVIKSNIERSIEHLKEQKLWGNESSILTDIDFQLPKLEGPCLLTHLNIIGEEQAKPYINLATKLIKKKLPLHPKEWKFSPGWTKYHADGTIENVDFPTCDALILDVEVCVKEGPQPTLATAVSDKYWYSWCSNSLTDLNYKVHSMNSVNGEDLIPMGPVSECNTPRIIIGHNVSYDRLRMKEQYSIKNGQLRFLDTMSLHIANCGLVNEQRTLVLKNKGLVNKIWVPWMTKGCMNSLKDCYKFYLKEELKKDDRDIFVKGNLYSIRKDFQNLMSYCASDVVATCKLLGKVLPQHLKRFPHPISFAGMLEMGSTFLPVTSNWNKYISKAESEYYTYEDKLNETLLKYAKEALEYSKDNKYKKDPWLWDLDWSLPKGQLKNKLLQNYPNWYRKLCKTTGLREGTPEPQKMTTSLKIVPKLLRLTWEGYPLHHEPKHGWGYLKPISFSTNIDSYESTFPIKEFYKVCPKEDPGKTVQIEDDDAFESLISNEIISWSKSSNSQKNGVKISIPGVLFFPLPHKDGANNKVGNPLSKDFLRKFEEKILSSNIPEVAEQVVRITKTLSYWRNNRDRIMSQVVVWTEDQDIHDNISNSDKYNVNESYGVILPQVIVAGTITRRAVERTWMTASNAYPDRIGSELKAMIEAPPGYHFVGADVDSQELWIAAVLGDSYFGGLHGCTALGWMTLQGKKSDGTDMHSRTAQQAEITRDHAKVINYGRIYGAGLKFVQQLLQQFNPNISEKEAKEKATQLLKHTKGERCWYLNKAGEEAANSIGYKYIGQPLSRLQVYSFLKRCQNYFNYTFSDVVEVPSIWMGGSESYTFNCLEAVVRYEKPSTPVLRGRISQALQPDVIENDYMPSRMNWVVQSSAVDYLHLLLVSMKYLCTRNNIDARFCISIHDEVRYLVATEDRFRAALALQIANLYTRSAFSIRLGMNDLPLSVAFFSGIDIDTVLRKEPHMECVTPSNKKGLLKEYGISPGETLDIYQILEKTDGKL